VGLFSPIFERRAVKSPTDDYWYGPRVAEADTGEDVGTKEAISDTAIYNGIEIISTGIAKTPLIVYRRKDRGKDRDEQHSLHEILRWQANEHMTATEFWEATVANAVVRGNAYAEIERARNGQVIALWPLWSAYMTLEWEQGRLVYHYRQGVIDKKFKPEQILHIHGFSLGGLLGLDPIQTCKNSVAFMLAVRKYGNKFFRLGGQTGFLSFPAGLSKDKAPQIRKMIEDRWEGLNDSQRVIVLEYGADWKQVGIDPEAAQMIGARQFSVLEAARLLNLPPHKLKALENVGDHKIEEQDVDFRQGTLDPWWVRIEQRTRMSLFSEADKKTHFAEFLREAQFRTDMLTVNESLAIQRQNGIISANEYRSKLNMNPDDDPMADELLIQLNMVPQSMLAEVQEPPSPDGAGPDDQPGDARRSLATPESLRRRGQFYAKRKIAPGALRIRLRNTFAPLIEKHGEAVVGEWVDYINAQLEPAFAAGDLNAVSDTLHRMWRLEGVGPGGGGKVGLRYADAKMTTAFAQRIQPTVQLFARQIGEAAAVEAGLELTDALMTRTEWIEDWVYNQGGKRAKSSLAELQKIARAASGGEIISTEGAEAVQANILQRMNAWTKGDWRKAQTIARRTVTQADGYIARDIWQRAGVKKLIWRNSGSENCGLCLKLNGRVVDIQAAVGSADHAFIPEGMMLDAEEGVIPIPPGGPPPGEKGRQAPIVAGAHVLHNPLHGGCDCRIEISYDSGGVGATAT